MHVSSSYFVLVRHELKRLIGMSRKEQQQQFLWRPEALASYDP